MTRKAIVFLEPVNHACRVILTAAEMGFDVIVLHAGKLAAPPPYEAAIAAITLAIPVADWFDEEAVLAQLLEQSAGYELCGVYPGGEIVLLFESRLRAHLQLPGHPRDRVGSLLNKYAVRKRLFEAGLTELACFDAEEIAHLATWPYGERAAIFKPANGGASALVTRCQSLEDVQACVAQWSDKRQVTNPLLLKYIEHNDAYFLEGCAEGELMSVETLVCRGEQVVLGIMARTVLVRDPTVEMGASFPLEHRFKAAILAKVAAIHTALDIRHGATHIELMVTDAGVVELVELNLRFAGADSLEVICQAYPRDIGQELVRLACGERPQLDGVYPHRFATMQYVLAPDAVTRFDSWTFEVRPGFTRAHQPPGTMLGAHRNQIDWIGAFIEATDSYPELIANIKRIRANLYINGMSVKDDVNNQVLVF